MKINNQGFTIVELVLAFATSTILIILFFSLLISLKNLYNYSGVRTELLIKQASIADLINQDLMTQKIIGITNCGTNCLEFNFSNNDSKKLEINKENHLFIYGNYTTKLVKGSEFGEPQIQFYQNFTNTYNTYDAFIALTIPISYSEYEDEDYGVNLVYQYNTYETFLNEVNF